MQKKPKISIIVPNYNHELFLNERLESVFNQTYQNFEVLLLDDASTDNSIKILSEYKNNPKVSHFIINKENSGSPFKQWEKGVELAKGAYIWIAESDDFCDINFLQRIVEKLAPEIGIYYTQTIDVDGRGTSLLNRIHYTKEFYPNIWDADFLMNGIKFIEAYLLVKNVIPNASAVLFKRDLVDADTFSKDILGMRMCGDWLFWIKLCVRSKIYFIKTPLNYFRNHKNITRNHKTIEAQKKRLKEERVIRGYVKKALNIKNIVKDTELRFNWFILHETIDLVSIDFYTFHKNYFKKAMFLIEYLKYKFKKWIH
ncbi:glycosyltransferase family 2 protein [Patiriisocius sp. Uisw_017]|uniref:glycosyltransferase family 2 protein n=1 Tax=Patiriisocius sp. Uisw_017 TaxID=3230968 RepID=UPI0039E87DBF